MSNLTLFRALLAQSPDSVSVTFGAFSSPGILDFEGRGWGGEGQAEVAVEDISLTYVYPDLPGLGPDSLIACDGVDYIVTKGPRRKGDGLEAVVLLETV
jgi:hypothetical protein